MSDCTSGCVGKCNDGNHKTIARLEMRIQQLTNENNRLEKAWSVMQKRCFEYEVTLELRKEVKDE